MADQTTAESVNEDIPGQSSSHSSSALLVRVTAVLFLVAVIGAECLLASLYLPGGSDSSSAVASAAEPEPKTGHAEKDKKDKKEAHSKDSHSKEARPSEEDVADPSDQMEVDLEQFNVTAQLATSNTAMRIEFHLYGVVNVSDKAEFEKLVKASQHRLRDQVLVIIRSAQPRDLADAGLGLIKRQILEKTNALLGKPLLRAVIVSDFSYMEQ